MPSLQTAFQYVIDACNDPYIGYSNADRTTITLGVTYKTFCDCSSLISKALTVAGYFKNNPWFSTGEELTYLKRAGWTQVDIYGEWQPGDILHKPPPAPKKYGHTEMVYTGGDGKGVTMGAHQSGVAYAAQVCINDYTSYPSRFMPNGTLWRDTSGGTVEAYKWHMSNSYNDTYDENMTANAYLIYQYFKSIGFTDEAIAGMLGNITRESTVNPGLWEGTPAQTGGYGLVQWTPASGWFDYAAAHNIDTTDADASGEGQCDCINNCTNDGQWLKDAPYAVKYNVRYTWQEFSQLTDAREALKAFCWEYLRPSENPSTLRYDLREQYCDYWYDIIKSGAWNGDPGDYTKEMKLAGILNDLLPRPSIR